MKTIVPGYVEAVCKVQPKLIRYAAAVVGWNDAKDVVQLALFKAWRLTEIEPDDWEGWLFRCTQNACLTYKERQKKLPQILSIEEIIEREN